MGQHKNNPNVKLAREGLLPKRPKKMSKKEFERELFEVTMKKVFGRLLP